MTVCDLYRVSDDNLWVVIKQSGKKIFEGIFKYFPENLMDCTIKKVKPSYTDYVDCIVIDLND